MKPQTTQVLLIFGVLSAATVCFAQPSRSPRMSFNANPAARLLALEAANAKQYTLSPGKFGPLINTNVPATPIAEAITPEIQALANGLQNDPVRIYNYVHDHIRHVLYFGSKKGAELTLLEKSGNDFDQCALLVALLRAAGYTNAAYQFGWMEIPYDSADHRDLHHWLQLSLSNTNWSYTSNYLNNLFFWIRGYPATAAIWGSNTFAFQRMWVTLPIGSTTNYLDPAFKVSETNSTLVNLTNAMQFSSNTVMTVAGGADGYYLVAGLDENSLRNKLRDYTTNLVNYLQTNCPNAGVEQVLNGWQIVASTNTTLSQSLPFTTYDWGGSMPIENWANQPTNLMSTFNVTFGRTNHFWYLPQLQGQRVSLTFSNNGLAQLWQDDTVLAQYAIVPATGWINVGLFVTHPVGTWNTNNNTFTDTGAFDEYDTNSLYKVNSSTYILSYAFEPDWGWLQQRQDKLNNYRQQGLPDSSLPVVCETMNIMGLSWHLQCEQIRQILDRQMGISHQSYQRLGRVAQESGNGYYFDMYMMSFGDTSDSGIDSSNHDKILRSLYVASYFESGLEGGVIEQLQCSNLVAASTVKMLEMVSTNGAGLLVVNSNNWRNGANVCNLLYNYQAADIANFDYWISQGAYLFLPRNGSTQLGGGASWTGYGYLVHGPDVSNNYWEYNMFWGTYIYGQYKGGQVSLSGATVNPYYVRLAGNSQPGLPPWRVIGIGADPVDMADGSFQIQQNDLSLGQAAPRGLNVDRYYRSRNHFINSVGMAPGWVHNYNVNVIQVPASQAGLGKTTPAQMAPILVATAAALQIYNDALKNAKNWMVTDLIVKWGVDQLLRNGVSVTMGKDTIQFVSQPDGTFTPPANCTLTLNQSNSVYSVAERHGRTFRFDTTGRLANVVDQYNQPLNVTYNSSNWVYQVTDWKNNRTLTFNYSGTPQRLASVTDGTRSVNYGYNSQGDLSSVTDPEGKSSTFTYDTNHDITSVVNALNQLVVTNFYDGFGRMIQQYTQGDTNKAWQVFWSGWRTVEQDPAGNHRQFLYDDKTRLIGVVDQLGNVSQTFYDGQDHIATTISPLNETNQFIYDGNHNLIQFTDALNFTNQFNFDPQNRLTSSSDGLRNLSRFGYNAQFSLTGLTNGAGDWATYSYNIDGTLSNRTDSAGTTTYGYDAYGQVNSITYPNSLGSESFVNSSLGDASSHTDGRGFVTTFRYNSRRQLTNAVAPTNVTFNIAFDAVGNQQSVTDARTNTTTSFWSPTRHLTNTVFPATPQGVPATTNFYDSRDWLVRILDPLHNPTLFTNDLAGRLSSLTDPLPRTTRFVYDSDGRKTFTTNAALEVIGQKWNADGEMTQLTDPATHTVLRSYDQAGNQIFLTNRNGKIWQFLFDKANRLTNTITPKLRSTKLAYNDRGLLQSVTKPSTQSATFGYDARGRQTSRTDMLGTTTYQYDPNNNLTNAFENGRTNSWTYDAYNRVSSYRDPDGNLVQYRRDQNGNVTSLIYPGNRTVTYVYDSLNRLTSVTDWANRQTTLAYDLASHLTSITRPNGTVRQIDYDAAGETTNIVEKTTTGFPIAFYQFSYDNAARVKWEFGAPLPQTNTAPPARTMTYNDDNQIDRFNGQTLGYDPDGNMTSGPLTNNTLITYGYNARNQLTNAAGLTYAYDPAANRVAATNGANVTRFVMDPNAKLSQVLMRVRTGVTTYYIYGPGLLYEITETASTTNTLTYHYDLRGSTIALTDKNGNVTDQVQYSAYGMILSRGGTNDTPFLYNGRYGVITDANGLLYMRARFYNPYICRFINPDPSGFAGGLNFYCYADGNPVSALDPSGLGAVGAAPNGVWMNGVELTHYGGNVPLNLIFPQSATSSGIVWNDVANVLVPGYGSFSYAASQYQAGNYGLSALAGLQGAGQVAVVLLTLGAGEDLTATLNAVEETGMANTFFHYTDNPNLAGQGLNAPSFVTDAQGLTFDRALGITYLDNPGAIYQYPVSIGPGIELEPLRPVMGLNQWRLPGGTPPGTIGNPTLIPHP